jgi:uncharacterized protein involved in type VI secretion and phage assembly
MIQSTTARRYCGKYPGTVVNNVDAYGRGRLLVEVVGVLGLAPSCWAEACVPLAGPTGPPMGAHFVPPIGAGVWVEFEQGDPGRPIWTGCRWGATSDVPVLARAGLPAAPSIVLQTLGQTQLVLSDAPGPTGGILLATKSGASILINDTGIIINNGKGATLTLVGPTVNVNGGALTVT